MEYICTGCYRQFDNPEEYLETHGLDSPPYERFLVCPYCCNIGYEECKYCQVCCLEKPESEMYNTEICEDCLSKFESEDV